MGNSLPLARKYRPLKFSDVLDQESLIKVLKNVIRQKKYSSPFMFSGFYGGGKTTLARIFARAILCKNLTEDCEPCNSCPSCLAFLNNEHVAYMEIDAASNSGVDSIRKLREDANLKVLGDFDRKVVVIDECHSISKQGNEALLKQLEESTSNQVYIFCTTAPENMAETVQSRCFELQLKSNSSTSISKRLEEICSLEKIIYQKEAIDLIASVCSPHVRDALKNLDFLSNYGEITLPLVQDHFNITTEQDTLKLIKHLKHDLTESLDILKKVLSKRSPTSIYESMIQNLLKVSKLQYGINEFRNKEYLLLAQEVSELYSTDIQKVLEELLKRNKYSDALTLESDIILLHQKVNNNFAKIEHVVERIVEKVVSTPNPNDTEVLKDKVTTKESVLVSEDKTQKANDPKVEEIDIEETSKILNRYKSYPDKLAMLMDKSKKSSSTNNSSTVELKHNTKDLKQNLSKQEIKKFLDSKRT